MTRIVDSSERTCSWCQLKLPYVRYKQDGMLFHEHCSEEYERNKGKPLLTLLKGKYVDHGASGC